jgi:hypothetical protein
MIMVHRGTGAVILASSAYWNRTHCRARQAVQGVKATGLRPCPPMQFHAKLNQGNALGRTTRHAAIPVNPQRDRPWLSGRLQCCIRDGDGLPIIGLGSM